ncbi:MAG: hypothetical protein GY805_37350 [Chloroflexi bacterium]|nr:hypothetical protein [Chloroflexota bacterium]
MRDARGRAICLNHLGDAALALDDFDEAKAHYQAGLTIACEIGDVASITQSHIQLGHVNLAKEESKAAKDAFFSALRQAPTVPLKLSTLIGIGQLLISSDPVCAGHIVAMVQAHPALPIDAKETAVALKKQLPDQKPSAKSLDELILLVLKA